MPVFTAIGTAIGLSGVAATAAGVGIAAGVGTAVYSAGQGAGAQDGDFNLNVPDVGTGALTEAEAQTAAKKRAYRSGVLFTSPTGLDDSPDTASAKLK